MEAEIKRLTSQTSGSNNVYVKCKSCGGKWHDHMSQCPAVGKMCHFCKKANHFKSQCTQYATWGKKKDNGSAQSMQKDEDIQFITDDQVIDNFNDFVFRVSDARNKGDILNMENVNFLFINDSGASINVMDSLTFGEIQKKNPSLMLQPTSTRVSAYANKVTPMKGIFFSSVMRGKWRAVAKVYVTEEG